LVEIIVTLFLLGQTSHAYEIDNFTPYFSPMPDAREIMNKETNRRLAEAVANANKFPVGGRAVGTTHQSCDYKRLMNEVYDQTGGRIVGGLEEYADEDDAVPRIKTENENSVYSNGGGAIIDLFGLESVVNIGGHQVGADKFGHFFSQGYDYYAKAKCESDPCNDGAAFTYGEGLEDGGFGLAATGVKSYGDLSANYGGYIFWQNLARGSNPYVKCVNQKWVIQRQFDWSEYVTEAWNEAINCSEFEDAEKTKKIQDNIKRIGKRLKAKGADIQGDLRCPVVPEECVKLKDYYGKNASHVLSKACLNAKTEATPEGSTSQPPSPTEPTRNSRH
jgi:hypothetical protein